MAWTFLDGTKFTSTSTVSMTFDGANMWVSKTNNTIGVYGFFGDNDNVEESISLAGKLSSVGYMIKVYDQMYVFDNTVSQFVIINITTKKKGGTISIPRNTDCVPAYGNNKIWFVTLESNNIQKLFYYDLSDNSWSTPVNVPGKHQSTPRKIIWGRDDYVYVVNVNESGLSKFNADTGAYITQIITNRTPADASHVSTNDNFEILVSGFNGMMSSVNQATNASTNISGLGATTTNFVDDETYLWTIKPTLARVTKGTAIDNYLLMKDIPSVTDESHTDVYFGYGFSLEQQDITSLSNVKEGVNALTEGTDYTFEVDDAFAEQRVTILRDAPNVTGTEPLTITMDYSYTPQLKDFEITGFSDTSFKQVLTTPKYTHQYWDEDTLTVKTKTEPQRIVLLSDTAIYFAYNLTDSWVLEDLRPYELNVKGTALVGVGAEAYHGETQ